MRSAGIRDCIVEPRPHPDYLGAGWWRDLDHILSEAEKLDMGVWLFDDGGYPSGFAGGELARRYPQHTKRYWAECHMDAAGPLPHAHFLIDDWLAAGEELLAVVAARRTDGENELDAALLRPRAKPAVPLFSAVGNVCQTTVGYARRGGACSPRGRRLPCRGGMGRRLRTV